MNSPENLARLDQLFAESQGNSRDLVSKKYWDVPLQPETKTYVERFLRLMPEWMSSPDLALEPDGSVVCDWGSGSWAVSISIDATGALYYAALFHKKTMKGRCQLVEALPEEVEQLLAYWTML
jgi:hypothetical protein